MSSGNRTKLNRKGSFDFIYLPWYQFTYVFSTFLIPWYYTSNPVKRLRLTTYLHRTNNSNVIPKSTWSSFMARLMVYCKLFWLCWSVLVDFYPIEVMWIIFLWIIVGDAIGMNFVCLFVYLYLKDIVRNFWNTLG